MGHSRSEIFEKYYLSQVVGADVMSAYLGTPSKDALNRLAGHMSLTRDPRALAKVRERELSQIHDPEQDIKVCRLLAKGQMNFRCRFFIVCRYGRGSSPTRDIHDFTIRLGCRLASISGSFGRYAIRHLRSHPS